MGFERPSRSTAARAQPTLFPALPPLGDSSDQLRIVSAATFRRRRLMSRDEARFFYAAEDAVADIGRGWRVMAQVCLGEILWSPSTAARRSVNSKRVDLLIIARTGEPLVAIEYQGSGHFQGDAPARDAVKKEALRKAGVRYLEMTPEHGPADLKREIARIAKLEPLKPAA